MTFDQLQAELKAAVRTNTALKVHVRADKQAPFGEVIKLIDATTLAQVGALRFETEKALRP